MWGAKHAREKLLAQPFPEGWDRFLQRNVAHFHLLTVNEQARLENIVRVMTAEKYWEGCQGLEVTDEMKVTITAQAGLMLLGMEHNYFDRLPTILLYPSGFRIPHDRWQESGGEIDAAGQAVYRGPVILAWNEALAEGRDLSSGDNVVIHEFAHQLDFLDGYAGGTPELADPKLAERWESVMSTAYAGHLHDLRRDRQTILGEYAGSNRTEFFAVVSERFFTVPATLQRHYPALYDLLVAFYRIDPIKWFRTKRNGFE